MLRARAIGRRVYTPLRGSRLLSSTASSALDDMAAVNRDEVPRSSSHRRLDWLFRGLGFFGARSTGLRMGNAMWQTARAGADRMVDASDALQLPDRFVVRNGLACMHVWLLNKRLLALMSDSNKLPKLVSAAQEALFDELWRWTVASIRSEGVDSMVVSRTLRETQLHSLGAMVRWDQAQLDDVDAAAAADDKHGHAAMIGAIVENVYHGDAPPPATLSSLAQWVYSSAELLDTMTINDVLWGKLAWIDPPGWQAADSVVAADGSRWRSLRDEHGRTFYENESDGRVQWEEPHRIWSADLHDEGLPYWYSSAGDVVWDKPASLYVEVGGGSGSSSGDASSE